ncbi:MAG TPA: ParA family protein, partial [Gallionella sp.]|nr:ParA family protein [Gallionella sp.]
RRKLSYDIYDKLKERYGDLVCTTRIGESAGLATCPMHGKDIFEHAPNSPGATDYQALTKELWDDGFFA